MNIKQQLQQLKQEGKKAFAVLIDPDDIQPEKIVELAKRCDAAKVDLVLFGGSLMLSDHMEHCIADAVADGGLTADQALREFKSLTKYL